MDSFKLWLEVEYDEDWKSVLGTTGRYGLKAAQGAASPLVYIQQKGLAGYKRVIEWMQKHKYIALLMWMSSIGLGPTVSVTVHRELEKYTSMMPAELLAIMNKPDPLADDANLELVDASFRGDVKRLTFLDRRIIDTETMKPGETVVSIWPDGVTISYTYQELGKNFVFNPRFGKENVKEKYFAEWTRLLQNNKYKNMFPPGTTLRPGKTEKKRIDDKVIIECRYTFEMP